VLRLDEQMRWFRWIETWTIRKSSRRTVVIVAPRSARYILRRRRF